MESRESEVIQPAALFDRLMQGRRKTPVDDRILVKRQDLENILYCLTAEGALADGIRIVKHYLGKVD